MQIYNRYIRVNGLRIFYREAGDPSNPTILLLHGFPSSSLMFKNLMTALSGKYHLIAPDYPGFGFSEFPENSKFDYTFGQIALLVGELTELLALRKFSLYVHDYGCPIGLRLCLNTPEKIGSLIIQNGNAYREGIGEEWNETIDYWAFPTKAKEKKVREFLSEAGTKMQYTAGLTKDMIERLSPELWLVDWELMRRNGVIDMQFKLNIDFQDNMRLYPDFQEYFRRHQPKTLVLWGEQDPFFNVAEAECYKRDLKNVEVHILNGSHMLLETNFDEVLRLLIDFLE